MKSDRSDLEPIEAVLERFFWLFVFIFNAHLFVGKLIASPGQICGSIWAELMFQAFATLSGLGFLVAAKRIYKLRLTGTSDLFFCLSCVIIVALLYVFLSGVTFARGAFCNAVGIG